MKRLPVLFLAITYGLLSFSPKAIAALAEWKLEKKKKGIEVYSQENSENKYKNIKSITTIEADINTIVSIYRDFKSYPEWQNFMQEIDTTGSVDENNFFAYAAYDFPWPISNRDIVIRANISTIHSDQKTVTLEITGTSHPNFPEKNGMIRIKNYHCTAVLEELNPNQTKITYTIEADPGGNMPALCVNMAAKEAQFLTLTNLKKLVQKRVSVNSDLTSIDK